MSLIKYETQLYKPIKDYFELKGFKVMSEVNDCDITAIFENNLIIIELKKSFNLKLLYQLIERKSITPFVFAAIPKPNNLYSKNNKSMIKVLKSLEIGLITVSFEKQLNLVEVILQPQDGQIKNKKKNKKILKEIEERICDFNTGGSKCTKIITSYRQKVIYIACVLEKYKQVKINMLIKNYGCDVKTGNILRDNFYGWFERVKTGVYTLTDKGLKELNSSFYNELTQYYRKEVNKYEIIKK